jgi:DNA-binding NarL/FixJ family response regulator
MAHSAGIYKQAEDMLEEIDKRCFTKTDYVDYYQAKVHIYTQLYTNTQTINDNYGELMELYKDSLINILPAENETSLLLVEERLRNQDKFDKALKINDIRLKRLKKDTSASPEYALAAFHRAYTYRMMGDNEKYKYYLALSAISDIVSATRDHASLWMLAETLLAEQDVDRAYNYMRFSWDEILLFNAHVRKWQSADILYAIDGLYSKMLKKQNRKLFYFTVVISLLAILLIVALYYNRLHRKKLSVMGRNLQTANEALVESNRIKEEYIGQFIRMCSLYILKLDEYRRLVIKRIKNGQTNELLHISERERELDKETDDLLHDFDTAFLNIFPNFVEKFNKLLLSDQHITLKKGEILNTELRVYALIRLGISDSAKIAEFLHLSVNTVYNIRVRVKNKAIITRQEFDERVKNIE